MAKEVTTNKHGNGHENWRKPLGINGSECEKVQYEVNRQVVIKKAPVKHKEFIYQKAKEIINHPKAPKDHLTRKKWLAVGNATYQ